MASPTSSYAKIQNNPNYYEAIIQIRPKNQDILDFVRKRVSERKDVFISKELESKYGYDIYLTSQRFARNILAKKLKLHYKNAEIKSSRALHSRHKQTGKELYRSTILIRLKEQPLEE
ncbi:MAG: NMD3-related protein [Candidatus Nanoarchaeia archaeon]|nr:NMD3-related protein [Candidatus Nanoarchaeia archaeon]